MGQRGMSLGTTLLVAALMVTLGFALAALCVAHLQLDAATTNRDCARNLANSAVAQAIELIQTDPKFGESVTNNTVEVHYQEGEGVGWLTFNPARSDLVTSYNNLGGLLPLTPARAPLIPTGTARLVGEGRFRGVTQRVETWLRIPALPVLATQGGLQSRGPLMVAAIESLSEIPQLLANPAQARRPADVISNLNASPAIVLAPDTRITGDVQSVGDISLGDGAGVKILGELRTFADPSRLPTIDLSHFDPQVSQLPHTQLTGLAGTNPSLGGLNRIQAGHLQVAGDLTLNEALLFVQGNLRVNGGIRGRGLLCVTGSLEVGQGCSLDGSSLALLAGGPVKLRGRGRNQSFVQGVVHTAATLEAEQITVVGSVIALSPADPAVTLTDCIVLGFPEAEQVEVKQPIAVDLGVELADGSVTPLLQLQVQREADGNLSYRGRNLGTGQTFTMGLSGQFASNVARDQLTQAAFALVLQGLDPARLVGARTRASFNYGVQMTLPNPAPDGSRLTDVLDRIIAGLSEMRREVEDKIAANGGSLELVVAQLSLSRFLRWEDRLGVVWWRPLP